MDAYKPETFPEWQNRIVAHAEVDAEQLLANPFNFRIHSKLQQNVIAESLSEIGWVKSVVVNRVTGHIVDGHSRVTLALRAGRAVPVEYVDLTEDEEKLALASLDYIVTMASTDAQLQQMLLTQVNTEQDGLKAMFAGMLQNAEDALTAIKDQGLLNDFLTAAQALEEKEPSAFDTSDTGYVRLIFPASTSDRDKILEALVQVRDGEGFKSSTESLVFLCDLYMDGVA